MNIGVIGTGDIDGVIVKKLTEATSKPRRQSAAAGNAAN
jgi:hypothetical protein